MERGPIARDGRLTEIEQTLGGSMLHCLVMEELEKTMPECAIDYDESTREHMLYLAHYWQQAVNANVEAKLVPHDPSDNIGLFEGNDYSWEANEFVARHVVENYDEFIDHFKNAVETHSLKEVLDEKSLVVAVNHQTYINPAEVAHGLAVAMKDIHGIDIRDKTHIAIGPRITTHMTETRLGEIYLPEILSSYSNWFLTVPDTTRGNIPGAERLVKEINKQALRHVLGIKKNEPGSVIIIAPSGMRDLESGEWSEEPSPASYSLIAPSKSSVLLPIALADRGAGFNGKIRVGTAIGDVYDTHGGKLIKTSVKHLIESKLYGELLAQAEAEKNL